MTVPKVSICMPVFNGGRYFRSALESALAQDYSNLEIVVVNDGSTDGGETEHIALEYGDRIRYFYQPNSGVAGAMNTALAHMTGDFFAWLSHDDIHLPHKTSSQVAYLCRLGRPNACLFSDFDLIGPEDEPLSTFRAPAKHIQQNPRLALFNGMINGCTLLIPAEIMRTFGPFDERLRCTQDYDLWNRIIAQHDFFHQPEVLVRYRIHPDQGTQSKQAVIEGEALWQAMLESRNEVERAQMFGSTRRYFASLATFLDATPYQKAAAYAQARSVDAGANALVSVVIPFWNEVPLALRAACSALNQTHRQVEVLVVDDGSTEDISPLTLLAETEPRLRLMHQPNSGPAAARNRAMSAVQGDYVAFLDADDQFLPHKIERQLDLMQRHGALFSHTSYYVDYPERGKGLGLWHSGDFTGACYPRIIGMCPIAMPTVMLHRSLIDEGFAFPTALRTGEDVLAWIDLAMRYTLLGIDEPLSIVEWSDSSAALNSAKQVSGLSSLVDVLMKHPVHQRNGAEIGKLRQAILAITRDWIAAGRQIEAVKTQNDLVKAAFSAQPDFPAAGSGRVLAVPVFAA